jgi:hypothetical protein
MRNTRIRNAVVLGVAAAILAPLSGIARGEETPEKKSADWRKELARKVPEVPEDLWALYVESLRKTPEYEFAKALDARKLKPEIEAWGAELKLGLEVHEIRFLQLVGGKSVRCEDTHFQLRTETRSLEGDIRVHYYRLRVDHAEKGRSVKQEHYRVPRERIDALDFPYVNVVIPVHRIARDRIEKFTVSHQSLLHIVEQLFIKGGLPLGTDPRVDISLNAGADAVKLTMTVRDHRIVDCLKMALKAAGWKITVNGKDPAAAFRFRPIYTQRFLSGARNRHRARVTIDLVSGPGELPEEKPMAYPDRLRKAVFEGAEKTQKQKYRVVIGP